MKKKTMVLAAALSLMSSFPFGVMPAQVNAEAAKAPAVEAQVQKEGIISYKNEKLAMQKNKDAILVMSFGTTFPEARKLAIESVVADMQKAFPDKKVALSFSSTIVVKRVKEKEGITYPSAEEAMLQLKKEGYNRVAMISMDFMPGHEYDLKRKTFAKVKEGFKSVAMGTPLIYWVGETNRPDNAKDLYKAIECALPQIEENQAVLLMGHGTDHASHEYYNIFQQKINELGKKNVFVYTVEAPPKIEDVIPKLKEGGFKKVLLVPIMMVAGDHANNDMNGTEDDSHRTILEKAGFEVSAYLHGLGENQAVRDLIVDRAKDVWKRVE